MVLFVRPFRTLPLMCIPQLTHSASNSGTATAVPSFPSTPTLVPAFYQPASQLSRRLTRSTTTSYWNVNVPTANHTDECPDFLQNVLDRDRQILATRDEDYRKQDWARIVELIRQNRLDLFERKPSDLRRYMQYIWDLKVGLKHLAINSIVLDIGGIRHVADVN